MAELVNVSATVAALYVSERGPYVARQDVDAWTEKRDARMYAGNLPVIAHPPCAAWCRWANVREIQLGLPRGEDGGCFAAALDAVRTFGGVLEHPAHSSAWAKYGLAEPIMGSAWIQSVDGSWVCSVDQAEWGMKAHKPTWLLYVGSTPPVPLVPTHDASGARPGPKDLHSGHRHITPATFADALVDLVRKSLS